MRKILLYGCAAIALQCGVAQALTEPKRMEAGESGDDRVRIVYWRAGAVIKAVAARGQSLMVEMPPGFEFGAVMLSDQDVMDGASGDDSAAPDQAALAARRKADRDEGCNTTSNLQVCIQRKRFMFLKPTTILSNQPIPMVLLETVKPKKPKKDETTEKPEPIEHPVIFELSTISEADNKIGKPYYQIKLVIGDPPASLSTPIVVPAPAPSPPVAAVVPPPAPPPLTTPPAVSAVQPRPTAPVVPAMPMDDDSAALLANRQHRKPIVAIPPRPGLTAKDKALLESVKRISPNANIHQPIQNDKYVIQGDRQLIGR